VKRWSRALPGVLQCAVAVLAPSGCSDDGGCGAACQPAVSFRYEEPRKGSAFRIELSPQGGTIDCELSSAGEATCEPMTGPYQLTFRRDSFEGFSWTSPPPGELHVQVTIDGSRVTNQRFDYRPTASKDACTGDCAEDPRFILE